LGATSQKGRGWAGEDEGKGRGRGGRGKWRGGKGRALIESLYVVFRARSIRMQLRRAAELAMGREWVEKK